jgi:nicotinate-nucleotide--dimethylbenzimidazole phosphoribosyltransferase
MPVDLFELVARVPLLDDGARDQARALLDELSPSLGRLGELSAWLAGAQGHSPAKPLDRVRLVVFAGDHGSAVHERLDTEATVLALVKGTASTNALAEQSGVTVRVVDVAVDADGAGLPEPVIRYKVRRGSGRVDIEDALTRADAEAAFAAGVAIADEEVDGGADLLVAAGIGRDGDISAATLATLLTSKDVASVVGSGPVLDDIAWMRTCAAVRDAARRGRRVLTGRGGSDVIDLLATVGGPELAALTGFLVQSAVRRTPVVLDGLVTCAAAAVARRLSSRVPHWLVAGHRTPDPGQAALLERLRLTPIVDLQIGLDDGFGALLAVPPLRAAAALPTSLGAHAPRARSALS